MALRLSKALRNFLNEGGSLKRALSGGKLLLYTGSQPTLADDAVAGTLLCTYTAASGTHTAEVLATGGFTIGGGSGSVDTLTVNSIEIMGSATNYNTSVTQTAVDVCYKINNNPKNFMFTATNVAGVITLTAKPGLGSLGNGWVVTGTSTTLTLTPLVNIGSGVSGVTQINGLKFGDSAAGALAKATDQVWSGVAGNTGTAGWFRFVAAVADAGAADGAELYVRLDGNVATSGANMNLSSTTITAAATQTISTAVITEPAA